MISWIPDADWQGLLVARGHNARTVAFRSGGMVYAPETLRRDALRGSRRALTELVHEWHHLNGLPGHPHDRDDSARLTLRILALDVLEAARYGCDERAFTHWLRWRRSSRYAEGLAVAQEWLLCQ